MGKKSLIKSTAKKKSETKTPDEKKAQKPAAKTDQKAPAKAAKKATEQQPASKAESADKPVAKSKPASNKLTLKEITFLKFDSLKPSAKKISPVKPKSAPPTAPPLITAKDAEEASRLRTILSKRFSMAEIKAAAKAPAPKPAKTEEPMPQTVESKPEPKAEKIKETPRPEVATSTPAPKPAEEIPYVTVEPATSTPQADPVARSVKIAAAAAALVIFLVLALSANNSSKYYIKPADNAIEIWKGSFSPKDNHFFMVLHGAQFTEPVKDVYSKNDVFPLIFNYYVDKADALLEVKGLPDFDGIKEYLHNAQKYAVTSEMRTSANERLNAIERMILLYKADVAFSRNTVDSLESAIAHLKDAGKLTPTTLQSEEITQKIAAAREALTTLKTKAPVQGGEE